MSKKKITIIVLCVSIVCLLAFGGTLAYFTERDAAVNTFAAGNVIIDIKEPNWNPKLSQSMTPGTTLMKDPTVISEKNTSYMRAIVKIIDLDKTIPNPSYAPGNGEEKVIPNPGYLKPITDQERLELIYSTIRYDEDYDASMNPPTLEISVKNSYTKAQCDQFPHINTELYTLDTSRTGNGVYYYNYNSQFTQGSSSVLFSNIIIPSDWTSADVKKAGTYRIDVSAEAIQVEGFASASEAFDALDSE